MTQSLMLQTSKRWDLNMFSDRERQEKFNKLMVSPPLCSTSNISDLSNSLSPLYSQNIHHLAMTNTVLESEDALVAMAYCRV
jgi:hypothetical protein